MKHNRIVRTIMVFLVVASLLFPIGCSPSATQAPTQGAGNVESRSNIAHGTAAPAATGAPEAPAAATQAAAANEDKAPDDQGKDKGDGNGTNDDGLRYFKLYPDTSNEEYNDVDEIGFRSPKKRPLSTFSVDPDSAAYSNIRRLLTDGSPVPKDAVRIEELVNYFHYDYPQPQGDTPFSVSTEYAACPWNSDHKLMLVGLQGKDVSKRELPPSNLVFLLDVSGSMADSNKLPLVKRAFLMLADRLTSKDTVSIVTYASGVDVKLEGVSGSKTARIMHTIEDLDAGGSTAGASGLQMAYDVAADYFIEGGNNRVILATDGDFNVGPSSDEEMVRLIERKRNSGVFLSVMGFGMGNLKDGKMESMAKNGNGNYAYIDSAQQARKVMVQEMGGTLLTIAKDVKIQVEFNPEQVKGYRLIGYENNMLADADFNNDRVDAGEIGAGHRATALYEIIPADSSESVTGSELKYQSTDLSASGEICTVSIRYKQPDGNKSQLLTFPIRNSIFTSSPSDNFQFASAVAEFGLLLRDSRYKGDARYSAVYKRAEEASDDDLKDDFLQLVELARENE